MSLLRSIYTLHNSLMRYCTVGTSVGNSKVGHPGNGNVEKSNQLNVFVEGSKQAIPEKHKLERKK